MPDKWYKSYFWDKIFPIILTGIVSFIAGFCTNLLEVRSLKEEVQSIRNRESTIQAEIKDAIASKDPSRITVLLDRLNRQK